MKNFFSLVLGVLTVGLIGAALFIHSPATKVLATSNYCHPDDGQYPFTVSDESSRNSFVYNGSCPSGDGKKLCQSNWCNNNQPGDQCSNIDGKQSEIPQGLVRGEGNTCVTPPVDQCSNIEGNQATIPDGDYQSDGECFAKTPVCTDPVATNYFDGELGNTQISDKSVCEYKQTPTPTPQQPPNQGGPGDGRSDGRSDGLSSCPSCTQPPKSNGQVLGATTEFAGTGVAEDMLMNAVGAIGGLSTVGGLVLSAKKKFNV